MGDIFITYGLPHIDEAAGGDIFATIEAVENVISRATEGTKIIPGHGPVCSKKELLEYRKLLVSVRDNVVRLFKEKKSIDQIVKETIAKIGYENRGGEGFIEQVYRSVQRHEEKDNSAAK
jgi:glyoxylase-like metal-dependent hydrolase (beta-lactamase superfamily II)